jgi:hypothetical protein
MVEHAPAALNDPEIVRYYASLGLVFVRGRLEGLRHIDETELRSIAATESAHGKVRGEGEDEERDTGQPGEDKDETTEDTDDANTDE